MTEEAGRPERSAKAQRLRIRFGRGPEAAELGHLDLTRIWERALEGAGVAVAYSQGNRPQPRLTLAAGLPMGVTSDGELLDVIVSKVVQPSGLCERLNQALPAGLLAFDCREVGMGLASLPSAVRWADYEVDVDGVIGVDPQRAIEELLAAKTIDWEDTRGERARRYDLRPLVVDLAAEGSRDERVHLRMRLRCEVGAVGRAEQVVKALGLPPPTRVHRRRLFLADESPARTAWRRYGRYR